VKIERFELRLLHLAPADFFETSVGRVDDDIADRAVL
jgi:hypothetical protein